MALLLAAFAKPNYVASENEMFVIVNDENTLMVKGKVSNEKGEALPGASIIVAGSHYGTITDAKGNFALDAVVQGSDIVISFVGYETVKAKSQASIDVKLKRSIIGIDLVAAKPKAKVTTKKATSSKNPLILVDGKTFEGDINSIDQNNVEKMEVLKEASATKMYGNKGKNGVVLVTTKKQVQASPDDEIFVVVENMPEFKGGTQALKSYIDQSTAGSKEKGAVQVTFTVTNDGSLDNIKVVSSPSKTLSSKTIAIMKAMPAWKPGKQRGKAISVDYSLKLEFQ
jgi:TonB-dependent SusC/RagA subfamily outer membrane receptor